jgi:hypothetical protein
MTKNTNLANKTPKGRRLLRLLSNQIDQLFAPPSTSLEQRVAEVTQQESLEDEQKVIDASTIITIP